MICWDRKINQMLQQNAIDVQVYSRYVEDVQIVDKAIKSNLGEPKDRASMREIPNIANGLRESMRVKIDFPSNRASSRMPVPDPEQ